MGKLFDLDSPLMRVLSKMADLMILNLLMIVLCLPIVTAGAAFTAMHYVLLKMVRDEDSYLLKSFFKSFKLNFRQATIIWAIMLGITVLFIGDFVIMKGNDTGFPESFARRQLDPPDTSPVQYRRVSFCFPSLSSLVSFPVP